MYNSSRLTVLSLFVLFLGFGGRSQTPATHVSPWAPAELGQLPPNANAIMIWDDMLSSGRKLTGRGGSDAHHGTPETPDKATKNSPQARANYVGTPTTWVFATDRTAQAVVDALTNGRVSVSANPFAPRVELYADLDGDGKMDMMMGDNVKATGL